MSMTGAMKGYGHAARSKAEAMSHQVKHRVLVRRLDRAHHELDRLRFENGMLRDGVDESRTEHQRLLDMIEGRLTEDGHGHRRHPGRWLLFLLAIGGGAYALIRRARPELDEWAEIESGRMTAGAAGAA